MELEGSTINCNDTIPSEAAGFILAMEISVSVTCFLSILGSSLIILTYVAYKDLRTTARQLLFNLSIADWIVAVSHLLGVLTNYRRFLDHHPCNDTRVTFTDTWCAVQGGFAMFSSLGSFLWTIAVAVYLFVVVVMQRQGKRLVPVFYVLCWGIPAVLSLVFGGMGYLGYEGTVDGGWCYLRRIDHDNGGRNFVPQILGYEMWLYLSYLVLPVLYIWIRCNVHIKLTKVNGRHSMSLLSRVKSPDLKLIFIPLIFLLLRVWGSVVDIPGYYMRDSVRLKYRRTHWVAAFVLLGAIGASAQGFCNAILFCFFTKNVRQKLLNLVKCYPCRTVRSTSPSLDHEPTTQLDSDSQSLVTEDSPLLQKGQDASDDYSKIN